MATQEGKKSAHCPPAPHATTPADFAAVNKNMPQKLVANPRAGCDPSRIRSKGARVEPSIHVER